MVLNPDGRSGSGYDYLMEALEASAADYLSRLAQGKLPDAFTPDDYLRGNYLRRVPAPKPEPKDDDVGLHHAGAPVALPSQEENTVPPTLGDLLTRPPKGVPYQEPEFPTIEIPGTDKRGWLRWDGKTARISSLDDYVLHHRRRMKPCTSFDTLGMDSGENQLFGTPDRDYMHFCEAIAPAIGELQAQFPEEYDRYYAFFAEAAGDEALARRRYLINPMNFAEAGKACEGTRYYRIRVGACDADTAFTISMALALKLAEAGKTVDYALVWDRPHCEADYPGEVCDWIEEICKA